LEKANFVEKIAAMQATELEKFVIDGSNKFFALLNQKDDG
jgi:hypothetical protein